MRFARHGHVCHEVETSERGLEVVVAGKANLCAAYNYLSNAMDASEFIFTNCNMSAIRLNSAYCPVPTPEQETYCR